MTYRYKRNCYDLDPNHYLAPDQVQRSGGVSIARLYNVAPAARARAGCDTVKAPPHRAPTPLFSSGPVHTARRGSQTERQSVYMLLYRAKRSRILLLDRAALLQNEFWSDRRYDETGIRCFVWLR
ncbi:hypothetical protein EVAR_4833_1 [Eumeta japonica]|uniref:Uncharacterized protein n=1 Tax=Eumeta variegata TaxID=151549 RepID=A0A4C1T1Z1_EUMVA|nr:hypothetical protein EVAR_4833_1 [Eumeta japonica]